MQSLQSYKNIYKATVSTNWQRFSYKMNVYEVKDYRTTKKSTKCNIYEAPSYIANLTSDAQTQITNAEKRYDHSCLQGIDMQM